MFLLIFSEYYAILNAFVLFIFRSYSSVSQFFLPPVYDSFPSYSCDLAVYEELCVPGDIVNTKGCLGVYNRKRHSVFGESRSIL